MVTAYPVQLARVAEFLEAVSGSIQRQVVIQAKIIEIVLSDEYQLGIDWGYVTNSNGVSGTLTPWDIPEGVDYPSVLQNLSPGLGVFQIGVASKYFNLLIDSLARQGQLNVLSSPQLCTLNNQKAMIKVGREEVYFEINSELQVLDGTERVIENVESKTVTVGIVLDVTPQISSDGTITMCIHPSVSEVAGEAKSRLGDTRPIIDVREIDTVISVHEGQMIVIGGLIKDKVEEKITSVPFLGEIPYLGAAFRHTAQNKQKTELVILLTPTLMIGKKIETLTQQQLESLDTAKKGFHFGARPWDYGVQGEYHR
jgi:MSHA type pilus biogenesis protein MshL